MPFITATPKRRARLVLFACVIFLAMASVSAEKCTVKNDCTGDKQATWAQGNRETGCICKCRKQFIGDKCDQCATGYNGGGGFPTCAEEKCTLSDDCGGNRQATWVRGNRALTGCTCKCRKQFVGDKCDQCALGYNRGGYPTCAEEKCTLNDDCGGNKQATWVRGNRVLTGCTCKCRKGYTGPRCDPEGAVPTTPKPTTIPATATPQAPATPIATPVTQAPTTATTLPPTTTTAAPVTTVVTPQPTTTAVAPPPTTTPEPATTATSAPPLSTAASPPTTTAALTPQPTTQQEAQEECARIVAEARENADRAALETRDAAAKAALDAAERTVEAARVAAQQVAEAEIDTAVAAALPGIEPQAQTIYAEAIATALDQAESEIRAEIDRLHMNLEWQIRSLRVKADRDLAQLEDQLRKEYADQLEKFVADKREELTELAATARDEAIAGGESPSSAEAAFQARLAEIDAEVAAFRAQQEAVMNEMRDSAIAAERERMAKEQDEQRARLEEDMERDIKVLRDTKQAEAEEQAQAAADAYRTTQLAPIRDAATSQAFQKRDAAIADAQAAADAAVQQTIAEATEAAVAAANAAVAEVEQNHPVCIASRTTPADVQADTIAAARTQGDAKPAQEVDAIAPAPTVNEGKKNDSSDGTQNTGYLWLILGAVVIVGASVAFAVRKAMKRSRIHAAAAAQSVVPVQAAPNPLEVVEAAE